MKITIDQDEKYKDIEIHICCNAIDEKIEKLITQIRTSVFFIIGKKDNRSFQIQIEDIFYIESIDNKTFIYIGNEVYESNLKLYELEIKFKDTNFMQISKSCILNIDKLSSVKALLNGKYEAHLINDEIVIISRHYVNDFKRKFGL